MSQPEGHVYVIECGGYYKIGFSRNPANRARQLQAGCPFRLHLVGCVSAPMTAETQLHNTYADKRIHGEWFQLTPEDVGDILRRYPGDDWRPPSFPLELPPAE